MTHNQILAIYCSKGDCNAILKENAKLLQGIHLDINLVKTKRSLKKTYADYKKQHSIQMGDYIIAIDNSATCLFTRDYNNENLLHFESLHHFSKWLAENFGVVG